MTFGLINFNSKAMYVAVKPLKDTVKASAGGTKYNCLVFDPLFDRTHSSAMADYNRFFQNARNVQLIPLITEQGPGELAQTLQKQYGAQCNGWVGGMTAPVYVPKKSIDKLVADLTKDPMKYFVSEEKILFG